MITKRRLYYTLHPNLRLLIRRLYYLPTDIWAMLTGTQNKILPPKGAIFIGSGDFKEIGNHYLSIFKQYCGLQPHHRVLDIGCGIGRIALPLTEYLNPEGSYEGFDIVKSGIKWCKKNITRNYPNFQFLHIDLKNDLYNLKTDKSAKEFIFPYKENDFDLAVLTSVFTHMLPDDVENYFREISRTIKSGGKCLVTFFILNQQSKKLMLSSKSFNFKYDYGKYRLLDKKVKEANVAYEEDYLLELIEKNNLTIEKKLYGYWSGRDRKESFDFQDTFILSKK